MTQIQALKVDITTLTVDAIVNAANPDLLGGGGVDGAIHHAAGPGLLEECKTLGGCATGEAKITGGYQLPSKYVIHTVGPIWRGGEQKEPELLAQCYRNCLRIARDRGLRTLAFPAISCGVYGYPIPLATKIAVDEVCNALEDRDDFDQILFACFNDETVKAYQHALIPHRL